VSGPIAAATSAEETRSVTGSTGTASTATRRYEPALANAGCAVDGITSRGEAMPGRASRAALTASSTDSVPPEVTLPTAAPAPPSSDAAAATMSFSIASSDGNAVGSSPFVDAAAPYAASVNSSSPGTPGS
jgi:hypothetical protein